MFLIRISIILGVTLSYILKFSLKINFILTLLLCLPPDRMQNKSWGVDPSINIVFHLLTDLFYKSRKIYLIFVFGAFVIWWLPKKKIKWTLVPHVQPVSRLISSTDDLKIVEVVARKGSEWSSEFSYFYFYRFAYLTSLLRWEGNENYVVSLDRSLINIFYPKQRKMFRVFFVVFFFLFSAF